MKRLRTIQPTSPSLSRTQQTREAFLAKCRTWDWSKTDTELAEEKGCRSSWPIASIRRRIGAPKSPRYHQRRAKLKEPNLAKWRSWDWTRQNAELARETGLSRERIRQIRQLLDAPQSPNYRRDLSQVRRTAIHLQWAAENLARLKGLSAAELRRQYGFRLNSQVCRFLKAKGVLRHGGGKHPWHLMNWDLPSGVLERIWRLPGTLVAGYRWEKRVGAPRWRLFGGLAVLRRRGQLRAYQGAVRVEERKAAKYFAERNRTTPSRSSCRK